MATEEENGERKGGWHDRVKEYQRDKKRIRFGWLICQILGYRVRGVDENATKRILRARVVSFSL